MLLFKDGNFIQLLEGPRENVEALLEKIKFDPRHRGVIVLLHEEQEARQFPDWSMGFKKLSAEDAVHVSGDFLHLARSREHGDQPLSNSMRLLLNFQHIVR